MLGVNEPLHLISFLEWFVRVIKKSKYIGSRLQRANDAKETPHYKWVLIVTELLNIAVNDFDAKKSAHCSQVLVVTELVVSGTQCNQNDNASDIEKVDGDAQCKRGLTNFGV